MILFRLVYQREGRPRCITFPAANQQAADHFATAWLARNTHFWKDIKRIGLLPWQPGLLARQAALLHLQLSLNFTLSESPMSSLTSAAERDIMGIQ